MSIFPAYSSAADDEQSAEKTNQWLKNDSFQACAIQLEQITTPIETVAVLSSETSSSTESSSDSETEKPSTTKHRKSKKRKKDKQAEPPVKTLDFHGDEDYYVDKKPALAYKTISTLHKPACPRYHKPYRLSFSLGYRTSTAKTKTIKRYYREVKAAKLNANNPATEALDGNEYTLCLGQLNRKVMESPGELQNWLDLIALQTRNPYKWSRLLLAEKQIDIIKRAMVYHQRNDTLYRMFIETVSDTYPSFEVSKMLDGLLAKDAYSYTLWTGQIMTTQGSMARCIVPDVLLIYERCMQRMHHAQQQPLAVTGQLDSDIIMLKLFNNCALFLRQAGLHEQFIALVKLALELNISANEYRCFEPRDEDQRTLIEYEELILQSGLPMNEIWLRVEKLRQCYNFLPCPINSKCSDPQRIVFNEDVCHYIYPLKNQENAFHLLLLILRLLKLPFVQCDGLASKFSARVDAIGDSDAVEEALALGLRSTYALPLAEQDVFFNSLYELAKEMAVTPTFLSSNIGYEAYVSCIIELLLTAAQAYAGIGESKRVLFLLLLCRFERLLLVLDKAAKKVTPGLIKSGRKRFKSLLKEPANRNVLVLYTELALYEVEALASDDSKDAVQQLFENIIDNANDAQPSHISHAYLTYAEVLIGYGMQVEALHTLAAYALGVDMKSKQSISAARKLAAFQQITEKVTNLLNIEQNVEVMVPEQYLLPDNTVCMLKIRCLLQYLIGEKLEAMNYLEKMLKVFCGATDRHRFLRERIYEIYVTIARLPSSNCVVSNAALSTKLFEAIKEYPRNLYFLQTCATLALPWYRIRLAMFGAEPNILSLVFLIAAARFRFLAAPAQTTAIAALLPTAAVMECDHKYNEFIVRNRILHIFQFLTSSLTSDSNYRTVAQKALCRNALFWRLYLRCLSDQNTSFETSKKCLLTALDDCPWNKALYMDGATYVPQELSHLQDLMIEKQLRVYALPEELDILREQ